MCDICLEVFAVYAVECENAGETVDLDVVPMWLFLQETGKVAEAVQQLEKLPDRKQYSIEEILLCRVLEILQGAGAGSPEFGDILRSEWVRQTITAKCTPELISAILAMDLSFINEDALRLYRDETYFKGIGTLKGLPSFPTSWRLEVLRHLRDWWLKGEGLNFDPDGLMPGVELIPQDREKFRRLLRVYYLALQQIQNTPEERILLREIVVENPWHFSGLDLWLKRIALARLATWDPFGLPMLEAENRDVLYYYAAIKSGMSPNQRKQLADRIVGTEDVSLLLGKTTKQLIFGNVP